MIAQDYSISGTLLDEDKIAIPYANVIVKAKDSTVVTGSSTNDEGFFELKNLKAETYTLKASFVGFEDYEKSLNVSGDIILESIILKEGAEKLGEVVIVSKKPTLKKEVDRLVFNVANTALSEGSMLEVLRSTPGVLILDNSITIKNTPPTVYINDRKVHLSANELTQLLENSPANSIKKIEVITNPPAKYDAESGAVLNIVMSKNLVTGYRGNVFVNYTQGVFPRYNAGLNQFHKTKKVNLNVNYSFTQSKINRDNEENINYLQNNNVTQNWNTRLNRNTTSKTHNLNVNFDYFLDDNNTLSLSSTSLLLPYFDYSTRGESLVDDLVGTNDFSFNSNNMSRDEKHNLGFDVDYIHSFSNKAKLSFNAHLTTYDYNRKQNVNSFYFPVNDPNYNTAFNTKNNQDTNILTSQIDFDSPIGETASFSVGLKASSIKTESDITQFDINTTTNQETLNIENTNAYNYDESIFSGYLSFDKNWEKWNLAMGVRLEQTNIEGESITTSQKNSQDYLEWFPTANLSFEASSKLNIYTNFKRSIGRPSYQSLNPFNFFLNDNTIVTGNPTLQPAFTNHFVFGTTISNNYTFEFYYKDTKASIFELPLQDNSINKLVYSPTNLGSTKEFGFDFSTYFDVVDHWSIYFVTSFYNTKDEANIRSANAFTANQWSNYSVISNDFSFLKDRSLTANFTITYAGKSQQGFQIVDSRLVSDLGFKKKMFKKKGTLSLMVSDLFNKQDFKVVSMYNNQDNSNFTNLDNRYVKLGFSYKFGNTNLETNAHIKGTSERDRLNK